MSHYDGRVVFVSSMERNNNNKKNEIKSDANLDHRLKYFLIHKP